MADSITSNFFISKKFNQSNGRTRLIWNRRKRVHMLNLSQHSVTKIPIPPMATLKQHLIATQLLGPFTLSTLLTSKPRIQRHLKITKNLEWKKAKPESNTKPHTRKKCTSTIVKLSVTIRTCKESLEGIDKRYLGRQLRNLGFISPTSAKT